MSLQNPCIHSRNWYYESQTTRHVHTSANTRTKHGTKPPRLGPATLTLHKRSRHNHKHTLRSRLLGHDCRHCLCPLSSCHLIAALAVARAGAGRANRTQQSGGAQRDWGPTHAPPLLPLLHASARLLHAQRPLPFPVRAPSGGCADRTSALALAHAAPSATARAGGAPLPPPPPRHKAAGRAEARPRRGGG